MGIRVGNSKVAKEKMSLHGLENSFTRYYLPLRGKAADVEREYFDLSAAADSHREVETAAAVRVHKTWRGRSARKVLSNLLNTVLLLQRAVRGYLGRQKAREVRLKRDLARQRAVFDALAAVIQKRYRAFHSRKYKHNFYARKAYVAAVVHKSESIRKTLQSNFEQQVGVQQQEGEAKARARVSYLASKLHHLRSTESCASIYASPYQIGFQPTAFGIPVEQHLREAIRPVIKKEIAMRSRTLRPLQSLPPIPPALTPELTDGQVLDAARQDRWLSKTQRMGGSDFVTNVGNGHVAGRWLRRFSACADKVRGAHLQPRTQSDQTQVGLAAAVLQF